MIRRASPGIEQHTEQTAAEAPTFDRIARKRMQGHITRYRELLRKQASGEALDEAELADVLDCLASMALPDFTWARDCEAMQRAAAITGKLKAAVDAQDDARKRLPKLEQQVTDAKAKLAQLVDEQRRTQVLIGKPEVYANSLRQIESEHPHAMGDEALAIGMRLEAISRRRREVVGT